MNSRSEQIQVLYEIVTSIDTELDLQDMLKKCLSIYVRKLNCSAGVVFKLNQHSQGENYYFKEIVSIPRRVHNNPAYKDTIKQIPQEPNKQTLNEFYKHLPISLHISENQHCHIMNLPGFGLITFLKGGELLKVDLLNSLLALNNKIAYACKSCLNIEALRESEERYRTVFENTGTAMVIIEEDKTISMTNTQLEQLSGYSKEEIENKMKWTELVIPEDLERMKEYHLLRRKEKGSALTSYEFSFRDKLGGIKNIWLKIGMIPGTKKSVVSLTDITDRKTYEGKLKESIEDVIYTIGKITETRDPYTSGHQLKVSKLSTAIAQEMKLPQDKIEGIRIASLVHDIGKISIPSEILSKPSKLSEIEYRLIKNHSQIGYDILKSIEFSWPIAQIVLQHQERLNGSGYPQGLKGDDILLEAKIIAVADVIEAMSSHRPYRSALGINKALEEISINRGILYVPEVVDACIKLFKEKDFKF